MHIPTGRIITRANITPAPITQSVIDAVHSLAERDHMPAGLKIHSKTQILLWDSAWIAGVDYDEETFEPIVDEDGNVDGTFDPEDEDSDDDNSEEEDRIKDEFKEEFDPVSQEELQELENNPIIAHNNGAEAQEAEDDEVEAAENTDDESMEGQVNFENEDFIENEDEDMGGDIQLEEQDGENDNEGINMEENDDEEVNEDEDNTVVEEEPPKKVTWELNKLKNTSNDTYPNMYGGRTRSQNQQAHTQVRERLNTRRRKHLCRS